MTKKFEAHITYEGSLDFQDWPLDELLPGWTESWIDGDPILGTGVRTYLSANSNDKDELLAQAMYIAGEIYGNSGYEPVRLKIEKTIADFSFEEV